MFTLSEPRKVKRSYRGNTAAFYAKTRIYVSPKNESVYDNMLSRRSRPWKIYRDLLKELHPSTKLSWSQKAGCSCGCSPGFILDHTIHQDGSPVDLFFDVEFIN